MEHGKQLTSAPGEEVFELVNTPLARVSGELPAQAEEGDIILVNCIANYAGSGVARKTTQYLQVLHVVAKQRY